MFLRNKRLGILIALTAFLLMVSLNMLTGCQGQKQDGAPATAGTAPESTGYETGKPGSEPPILTIKGTGVEREIKFTRAELMSMEDALAAACYSTVNNWPTKKFFVGKGVRVSYLLEKSGIKNDAQTIIVRASDSYNATFTREQLEGKRYYFPNLLKGSDEGAREVPAILAWEHREGTNDLSKASSGNLCLLFGQTGLNDAVTPAYVKDVITLEVLTSQPGQWDVAQAQPASEKVKKGTEIVLSHPEQDRVKIYYTIDGSTPDAKSLLYNPSTTYFQPDLNKPIVVDKPVIIKTIAIGFGKYNSQVATFKYDIE